MNYRNTYFNNNPAFSGNFNVASQSPQYSNKPPNIFQNTRQPNRNANPIFQRRDRPNGNDQNKFFHVNNPSPIWDTNNYHSPWVGNQNPAWSGNQNDGNSFNPWGSRPNPQPNPQPLFTRRTENPGGNSWNLNRGQKRPLDKDVSFNSNAPAEFIPNRKKQPARKKQKTFNPPTNANPNFNTNRNKTPTVANKTKQPPPQASAQVKPNEIEAWVVFDWHPLNRLTPGQSEELLTHFGIKQEAIDPQKRMFRHAEIRKGKLWVICTSQQAVDALRQLALDLPTVGDTKFRLIVPNKKNWKWLAVLSEGSPKRILPYDDLKRMEEAIAVELKKIAENAFRPEIIEIFKKRGTLFICCNNDISLKWMKDTVLQLKVLEEGLKIVDPIELPVYCRLEIELPCKQDEVDKLLARLDRQNEGLFTDEWFIIRKTAQENGETLVFISADKKVLDIIRSSDNSLFLNFGKIKVKNLSIPKVKYPTKNESEN